MAWEIPLMPPEFYFSCLENNTNNPTHTSCSQVKSVVKNDFTYECKQQPNSISTKYEKTSYLKNFLFISGVVDLYFWISQRILTINRHWTIFSRIKDSVQFLGDFFISKEAVAAEWRYDPPSHPPPINVIRVASCVYFLPPPPHPRTPHCWIWTVFSVLG